MAKIRLGNAPESISYKATFNGWDGKEVAIIGRAKYRTRKQWAEMQDALQAKSLSQATVEDAPNRTMLQQQEALMRFSAEFLAGNILSWDLQDDDGEPLPVTVESLMELGDVCPQAVTALTVAYNSAVLEGRLGN